MYNKSIAGIPLLCLVLTLLRLYRPRCHVQCSPLLWLYCLLRFYRHCSFLELHHAARRPDDVREPVGDQKDQVHQA